MSMQRPMDSSAPSLEGKRILVIGAGKSGIAAAKLASVKGAQITLADDQPLEHLRLSKQDLSDFSWVLELGGWDPQLVTQSDLIILSPGVPRRGEWFELASTHQVPIWGEIELAFRFTRGKVIGITGSNGKSTVTTLVGAMLRMEGIAGGTGGNLSTPFAELLEHDDEDAVHVVEVSSFQLESIESFAPDVAALLNFSPDHLDRYPTYEDYCAAKANIFKFQTDHQIAVLNADDRKVAALANKIPASVAWFSLNPLSSSGACVIDHQLTWIDEGGQLHPIIKTSDLPLAGSHNIANALAACVCAHVMGVSIESMHETLLAAKPLPHRLESIATIGGVRYVNDSKATNREAAELAVRAWPENSVWWILGGKDKGTDWTHWDDSLWAYVQHVLLIGEAADAINDALPKHVKRTRCETLDRALSQTASEATPGQTVLLAPACASFDQFKNFEHRGDVFRDTVHKLKREAHDA